MPVTFPATTLSELRSGSVTSNNVADVIKTTYSEQSGNAQRSVVSTSASDSAAGTGLRTIKITYYDAALTGPYYETVTLAGTTAVNTVATNICFIESLKGMTQGSFGGAIGTISLKTTTGGGGTTIWSIAVADSETFAAHHYVPVGTICSLTAFVVAADGGSLFKLLVRHPTDQSLPLITLTNLRVSTGNLSFQRSFSNTVVVEGPVRIVINSTPDANGITSYAGLEFYDSFGNL